MSESANDAGGFLHPETATFVDRAMDDLARSQTFDRATTLSNVKNFVNARLIDDDHVGEQLTARDALLELFSGEAANIQSQPIIERQPQAKKAEWVQPSSVAFESPIEEAA